MTKPLSRYWKCQLAGWFIAASANFLLQLLQPDVRVVQQLFANLTFITFGVASSHGLRLSYRKLQLIELPMLRMIVPVLLLSLLATAAVILCSLTLLSLTFAAPASLFNARVMLANLVGIYPIMLIWSSLYLASQYLRRWRKSELDKLELAHALKDAQLNTLIGQINPHFMFNALNNIRALMLESVPQARDSLTLLANVLRYGLTAPNQSLVPLQSELETVHNFVALAGIQYEQRLQWQTRIEVIPAHFHIPPMMIQMLIENAIKHGIAQRKDGGRLKLHIYQQQHQLCIRVTNDGNLKPGASAAVSTQLGLKNIAQRLQLLYQHQASFHLYEQSGTVIADLRIPTATEELT